MKKMFTLLMAGLLVCLMTATSFAATSQEKIDKERAEIDNLSVKALHNLYEKVPSAENVINNCYAYATLSNTGMKLGLFGDAHGRGLAVNNTTGEKVYMRMKELGLGIGLGIKEYDLIFVIGTEQAWKTFISGDIKFASSADASASDGQAGGAVEGASIAANGIWVYQMTKKGLSLDASIKGTKIYADKKLNKR
ncbi:YSC84-related protein [Selenomonas ruminantium]|uniref:Lipid-binding SYLF domain-containing protein n=1 Tax=Selenomonas ruminantium TaxID=971 RepID=A0A1H3W5X8_SELRU|nr:YSC84-related protein [Selenomonas ruminantium]SDZ82529.1 Lipid-binding SYLF domain-containing protein [Selenomonas ruminantium]